MSNQIKTLQGWRTETRDDFDMMNMPSFTKEIMEEPLPKVFKILQFKLYNGMSEPMDHLKNFKALILLQEALESLFGHT